jgi:hypothetical protein
MAEITVMVRARVRGLLVARLFGHLPGSVGRWARCRMRVETRIGSGPWEEIGHWTEPA